MVLRAVLVAGAAAALAAPPGAAADGIAWKRSVSLGLHWNGSLVHGVQLPAEGKDFFTWDPVKRRSPDRPWRRWGNDRLVRVVLQVLDELRRANPHAPRIGVGDLSRPHGGDFGVRFGLPGHMSHQNGLDVDVYYPRKDRRERAPRAVRQIDRRLSQALVDRFVRAGAIKVFVGPRTGLTGPRGVVVPLAHHDNHLHVRLPNPPSPHRVVIGRSAQGRPIAAFRLGDPTSPRRVLVVGSTHGDEPAGRSVVRRLVRASPLVRADLWLVATVNPDGARLGIRQNARGVDLNRNFGAGWRRRGRPWTRMYPGRRPFSEPESVAIRRLARSLRPGLSIWFHQPQALVRAWGRSVPVARRYARLAGMRFRRVPWPPGTAPRWQNVRFRAGVSFVVELPAGSLSTATVRRHVRTIIRLARR